MEHSGRIFSTCLTRNRSQHHQRTLAYVCTHVKETICFSIPIQSYENSVCAYVHRVLVGNPIHSLCPLNNVWLLHCKNRRNRTNRILLL